MANPLDLWRGSWSPLREIDKMQSMMNQMMENFPEMPLAASSFDVKPSCECTEDVGHYTFKFDLPGIDKDQVKIELNDNILSVSAERREEKQTESQKTHYSEINYGSYARSFSLPSPVDENEVDAKFANGVLTVTVAKTEPTRAKKIPIQ